MIGDELIKTPYNKLADPYTHMTLIFIGFHVSDNIANDMKRNGYVRYTNDDQFRDVVNACWITLGKNVEIIVLGKEMVFAFLGEQNAKALSEAKEGLRLSNFGFQQLNPLSQENDENARKKQKMNED